MDWSLRIQVCTLRRPVLQLFWQESFPFRVIFNLAKTRWSLRDAVRKMFKVTNSLGLKMHRKEKFFIGHIEKGFSFLGYQFHPGRKLRPSAESLRRLVTNARRLYEKQGDLHRLGLYVSRWTQWLWSALPGMVSTKGGIKKYFSLVSKALHCSTGPVPVPDPAGFDVA